MELKLNKITTAELPGGARCILALKNKPFFFIWYHGEILMNKGMKGSRKTVAALREMWQYDRMVSCSADEAMDRCYNTIAEASGAEAAAQAYAVWRECAAISRRNQQEAAAAKWYAEVYPNISEDLLDSMSNYWDEDFLMGLDKAYFEARKGKEKIFDWMGESGNRAIFVYGFLMGMETAQRQEAEA